MQHLKGKRRVIYYRAKIPSVCSAYCNVSAHLREADAPWQGWGDFEADVSQPGRDGVSVKACQGFLWFAVSLRDLSEDLMLSVF